MMVAMLEEEGLTPAGKDMPVINVKPCNGSGLMAAQVTFDFFICWKSIYQMFQSYAFLNRK